MYPAGTFYTWMVGLFEGVADALNLGPDPSLSSALMKWQGQTVKGLDPLDVMALIPVPGYDIVAEALKDLPDPPTEYRNAMVAIWREKYQRSLFFAKKDADLKKALNEAVAVSNQCGLDKSTLRPFSHMLES